jgi:hypothetical protein
MGNPANFAAFVAVRVLDAHSVPLDQVNGLVIDA